MGFSYFTLCFFISLISTMSPLSVSSTLWRETTKASQCSPASLRQTFNILFTILCKFSKLESAYHAIWGETVRFGSDCKIRIFSAVVTSQLSIKHVRCCIRNRTLLKRLHQLVQCLFVHYPPLTTLTRLAIGCIRFNSSSPKMSAISSSGHPTIRTADVWRVSKKDVLPGRRVGTPFWSAMRTAIDNAFATLSKKLIFKLWR